MTVSFNRSAGQELVAAATKLAEVANLGGAFLDEYEAWEAQIKQHPLSCPEIAPDIRRGYLAYCFIAARDPVFDGYIRFLIALSCI